MNRNQIYSEKNLTEQIDHYYAFNIHKEKLKQIKNRKLFDKSSKLSLSK